MKPTTHTCLSCYLVSLLVILIVDVNAESKTYKVEDSCVSNGMSFSVDKGDEYELTYTGNTFLAHYECVYKFAPLNNDSKLCIKAYSFDSYNCHLSVTYQGLSNEQSYSCQDTPGDYCDPDGGKILTIKFRNGKIYKNLADDIKLKIAVEEGFNWIILVGVLCGLAALGITAFLIFMICTRCKKKPRGDSVSPAPPNTSEGPNNAQQRQRPTVRIQPTSAHEMSTQITPSTPSAEPTYEEDGIHKPRIVPSTEHGHSSNQPPPEPSAPPLAPSAPSYDNEPPPSYEQVMGKPMDV